MFKQTPNLLYLYLSNNALSEIDPFAFQWIGGLKLLSLNFNLISALDQQSRLKLKFIEGLEDKL